MIDRRRSRREGGTVQVLVAVALVALIGFAALAIDNGYLMATRTQLQSAADAGAHAGIGDLRRGMPRSEVVRSAREVSNLNYRNYAGVDVTTAADVEFGGYDFLSDSFTPNGLGGATAIRVTARRETPFFLAQVVGLRSAPVAAQAVAALGERDVMLVQDVTYSFIEELGDARNALTQFTQAMVGQSLAGDRIGLVTFHEAGSLRQPLVEMPDRASEVLTAIDTFPYCYHTALPNCGGTHIAPGIDLALQQFAQSSPEHAEKVVVLISDGVPCRPLDTATTASRRAAALAAAQRARDAGVSIYSVFLDKPFAGGVYCYGVPNNVADPSLMQDLVTHSGQFHETPDERDLDEILLSIVRSMPVRLVR